ncbi:MAG TPA: response regulator [Crinalium sp.]
MKILVVEDVESISELLVRTLSSHYYVVDVAQDGQVGLDLATQSSYDVILLDVMLPKLDGLTLCRRLRMKGCQTPILMLTTKDSNADIIEGLDAGADDYVAKSCDPSELLARIRALVRRGNTSTTSTVLAWEKLCLNPASAEVTYDGQAIALSPKEYTLLELFLRYPQRIFNRSAIINHLWPFDDAPTENAVTNLIKDLRRKLKNAGIKTDLIETVYGFGYRVKATPVEEVKPPALSGSNVERGLASMNRLQERFQASLTERIATLDAVEQALTKGELEPQQRKQAKEEAHRLAGTLGTFGYTQGSDLVSDIEDLLAGSTDLKPQDVARFSQLLSQLKQALHQSPKSFVPDEAVSSMPLVMVMDGDRDLTAELLREAAHWKIQMEMVSDQTALLERLVQATPAAILLNLNQTENIEDGLSLLRTCKQQCPAVPVIALTNRDSLSARIEVARAGDARFILKPATTTQIFETLAQILPNSSPSDAKVMLVDDDVLELEALTAILQPWGLQVTALSDANQFWDVLAATQPDLLLLDLEMPTFNGSELCRVVRQDATYGNLPILVVTGHTDMNSIQDVFAAGADDFIHKPIVGPELVTRVLSRIERSRLQLQLAQLRRQHSTPPDNR